MEDEEILKKVHKMIKILNVSPSTFMQEYGVNYEKANEETIEKQINIMVEIIQKELRGYNLSTESVKRIIEHEKDEQCKTLLVASTRDNEFIKKYVRKNSLRQIFINQLAIFTRDRAFIEECIDKSPNEASVKIELIEQMGSEYIKRYLKNTKKEKITLSDQIYLVCATHDSKYIQQFMKGLPPIAENQMLELIMATRDENFIIKRLRDKTISDVNKLIAIKELIKISSNSKATKEYIDEIRKGLDIEGKVALLVMLDEIENIKFNYSNQSEEREEAISLPIDMTIGIEIESVGKYAKILQNSNIFGWRTKEDSSLNDAFHSEYSGIELVSPILCNDGKIEDNLERICTILKALGQKTNKSCGAHVHIGADFLSNGSSLKNFLYLIENTEDFLFILSNEEGEIPRDKVMYYAEPFTLKLSDELEDGSININDEQDIENIAHELHKVQREDRYVGINFYNLGLKRNTIEFRMANGTLEPQQWIQNINLYGGLIKVAEEIMLIQTKNKKDRTEEENAKLELFKSLPVLNDEERLNAMLELAIDGNKSAYKDRYYINRESINNQIKYPFSDQFVLKQGMIKIENEENREI